jgi:hypothetical protein
MRAGLCRLRERPCAQHDRQACHIYAPANGTMDRLLVRQLRRILENEEGVGCMTMELYLLASGALLLAALFTWDPLAK